MYNGGIEIFPVVVIHLSKRIQEKQMKRISLFSAILATVVFWGGGMFLHAQQPARLGGAPVPVRPAQTAPAAPAKTTPAKAAPTPGGEEECDRDHGTHLLNFTFKEEGQFELSPAEALKKFITIYTRLDLLSDELEDVTYEYMEGDALKKKALEPQLRKLSKGTHDLYHDLQELVEPAWIANPQQEEVIAWMLFLMQCALDEDQYEVAYDLARELMGKLVHQQEPILYEMTGIAAYMVGQFPVAEHCFKAAAAAHEEYGDDEDSLFSEDAQALAEMLPYYRVAWAEETAARRKDTAADNLPQVLLKTTKGDVVVELFEDQAPNTVANFISLVEKGFYDKNDFHTVIDGFMAQTGSPDPEGTGTPGYTIADECGKPGARRHYRGSLSMAHLGPDTAGSQFFICLVPIPHLDGKYTVFGRVIQGMDVISALNRVDVTAEVLEDEPDQIEKAQVVRKRNHAYVPRTTAIVE